jgi:hypothetical protein
MSVGQFLRLRLVRLHPLVILGVLLGFASYLLDPWGAPEQAIALSRVVVALVMGLALIPPGHSPAAGPIPIRSMARAGACCRNTWATSPMRWCCAIGRRARSAHSR